MKQALLALALFLSSAPAVLAQDETLGIRWREWFANLNGHIQGQGDAVPAGDINLTRTLGLDDQENGHEIQLYLSLPFIGRLYAGYWWIDFDGQETLTRDITFADLTFSASTTVDTTLDLDMYYLTYEFMLPSIPLGGDQVRLDLGVQAGLRALLADASIESSNLSAQDDGAIGIPIFGLRGALQIASFLRTEFEIAGMALSYGSTSLSYVESFGEVVGQLGPAFAGVGYKWCTFDFDDSRGDVDFSTEIRLDGFYLTAGLRF